MTCRLCARCDRAEDDQVGPALPAAHLVGTRYAFDREHHLQGQDLTDPLPKSRRANANGPLDNTIGWSGIGTTTPPSLAEDGCITYTRGRITITDRRRMQANACSCYETIRRATDAALTAL